MDNLRNRIKNLEYLAACEKPVERCGSRRVRVRRTYIQSTVLRSPYIFRPVRCKARRVSNPTITWLFAPTTSARQEEGGNGG